MSIAHGRDRLALASAYISAAISYWLSVFPDLRHEASYWQSRADSISDPVLRSLALDAQRSKRANIEGSAAFAAFAPKPLRGTVVRAQVAFQSIYDYTDTLAEQPNRHPVANGRQLHQALLVAIAPRAAHLDYYAHQTRHEDGGYLNELVDTCRCALGALPSYEAIAAVLQGLGRHIVCYQSLNLTEDQGGSDKLARWAGGETPATTDLRWWETAASSGSSLGVFALMAAAARPGFEKAEATAIGEAYWPWVGALHSLLDSVVDEDEDTSAGQRSLLDYYESPREAADRLGVLAREALSRTARLSNPHDHAIILAGMVGSYLSCELRSERSRLVSEAVLPQVGTLAKSTILIFRCRQAVSTLHVVERKLRCYWLKVVGLARG
jgi:tetraprenyl-beta-curcumene synthase